mmetsp:Transcript_15671/g.37415  ORF Transcript_15671/g.37415 Transcript_15671/m.37415 type:complete len:363 (-) Transcript_15671:75-1163(-)
MCTLPLHQTEDTLALCRDEQSGLRADYDESLELLDILNGVEDGRAFKNSSEDAENLALSAGLAANEQEEQNAQEEQNEEVGQSDMDPESLVFGGVNPSMPSNYVLPDNSGGSGETGDAVSISPLDDELKTEEKKRRNREAARQSRAKKKRMIQSIEETQGTLEREKLDLRKENDALRTMNQALERQVAFFQSMFRSTFSSRAPCLIPETASTADPAWCGGANPTPTAEVAFASATRLLDAKGRVPGAKGHASMSAMGIVFMAMVTLGKVTDLDALLPNMEQLAISSAQQLAVSRHVGRMLLSLEPEAKEDARVALEEDTQVALLFAAALSVVISGWMLYRAGKWVLRRDGWPKFLLPKHHQS